MSATYLMRSTRNGEGRGGKQQIQDIDRTLLLLHAQDVMGLRACALEPDIPWFKSHPCYWLWELGK